MKAITDYWREYYAVPYGYCSLCGNSGVIDTTGMTAICTLNKPEVKNGRIEVGRKNYCICPNGQAMRNAFVKGRQLGRNHFTIPEANKCV